MLEISFARFMASMVTFSEETTPPHPFDRWDWTSIVGDQGICENALGCVVCDEGPERW